MNIDAYIASGILEKYCLGLCTQEEIETIEQRATVFPVINSEIEKIRGSLESYFLANPVKPSSAVKAKLMRSVYKLNADADLEYAPLIESEASSSLLASWLKEKTFELPEESFDNLFVVPLASTAEVTNFIVFAKTGHETEMHDDFIEYLYLISGSCIMDFEGEQRSYNEGEIIEIMPRIAHSAMVTSEAPMMALVQRQAFYN